MPRSHITRANFFGASLFLLRSGVIVVGVLFGIVIVSRLIYPFDTGHQEAFSWVPATHFSHGENPYSYASVPPYSMVPYGYVYYALLGIGIKLTGLNLWWGRALSMIAFAVCIWMLVRITRSITHNSRVAAIGAALAGLALFPSQTWVGVMRADLIAMSFGLAALSLALGADRETRMHPLRLAAIVLLCAAAFFTKHTFSLPMIVIFARYVQFGKFREAIAFVAAMAVCIGGGIVLLNETSNGGYVWQHFLHAQTLPWAAGNIPASLLGFLLAPTTLVVIVLFFAVAIRGSELIGNVRATDVIRSPKALIAGYLLLALFGSVLASGRVGANVNYFIELSFVMAIACGLVLERLKQNGRFKVISAFAILMICGAVVQLVRVGRGEYFRWESRAYYQELADAVAKEVRPGDVCFSVYAELVVRGGCTLYFDDYGEYTTDWSPKLRSLFDNELNSGRFAAIVLNTDNFAHPNYRRVEMSTPLPQRFWKAYLYIRK